MADTADTLAAERAAFEAWARTAHIRLDRWKVQPDLYHDDEAVGAWAGWQARAAYPQAAPAAPAQGVPADPHELIELREMVKKQSALIDSALLVSRLQAKRVPSPPVVPNEHDEREAFDRSYHLIAAELPEPQRSDYTASDVEAAEVNAAWECWKHCHKSFAEGRAMAAPAAPAQVPLTDEQIEGGRSKLFSVGNPFCPITEKAMRTAVRWAERCHGIGAASKGEQA